MPDHHIICPQCSFTFALDQALNDQFKQQLQAELEVEHQKQHAKLLAEAKQLEEQKVMLAKQQANLEAEKKAADDQVRLQVQKQLEQEKQKLWQVAQDKAKEKVDLQLKDYQEELQEKSKKLEEAQKLELEVRKQARELEDKQRQFQLEMERKLDEERKKIAETTRKEEGEQFRLKLLEKDKQVEIMQKTIEDLRRQSQQGSMQIQGEVQENDLKQLLSSTFFMDVIQDVPTGIKGADLIQTVNNQFGQKVGVLLWESKNTKQWSQEWITKLKQDQGPAEADICLLVSQVLPKEINGFGVINGVWVLEAQYLVPLVTTLRYHLLELGKLKTSMVGRDQKMEALYNYLCGIQFKNRVEAIVMAFSTMQVDLDKERRAMETIWRKRQKQIERVINNTSGFYGDLQGLMGNSLPDIKSLELGGDLMALESGEDEIIDSEPEQASLL